jgi:hypothetical protein
MKVAKAEDAKKFTDIPNVGPRMAEDFKKLGIKNPQDLKGKDALKLYKKMCALSGTRQDPCVLDTYLAVVDFMNGGTPKPWWRFTAARKKRYPNL